MITSLSLTYFEEYPDSTLRLIDEKLPTNDKVGIILQKENTDFQTKLNEIIAARTEDGTFKAIFENISEDTMPARTTKKSWNGLVPSHIYEIVPIAQIRAQSVRFI